ncbi:MAG TPA: ABC-ATPase UvrA, partial [Desulfobacteraceae bacterium]|nr:ABC-ATPase UvrA [Desulfobacteraceae bacterium]
MYRSVLKDFIVIEEAKTHNLKGISLRIPKGKITTITGPSGSGKSSLAFDTLYMEGQRRYLECISPTLRQFFEKIKRPEVKNISGLSPTISIRQAGLSRNPRSTVATITEVYDFLRIIFSSIGRPICPYCGLEISITSLEQIQNWILSNLDGRRLLILAPLKIENRPLKDLFSDLLKEGFLRVKIDNNIFSLDDPHPLNLYHFDSLSIVIDRLIVGERAENRIRDSLELAIEKGDGRLILDPMDGSEIRFNVKGICDKCGFRFPHIGPSLFSFNHPEGACPRCKGLGVIDGSIDGQLCPECRGARLKEVARSIKVGGKSINELGDLSIKECIRFFKELTLDPLEERLSRNLIDETMGRLNMLDELGVGYLTLNRPIPTLSGGEEQKVRIATQLSYSLSGVIYILDEPSMGLHPKDMDIIIDNLRRLKDKGNTVIVVEHSPEVLLSSDHIVELGPSGGDKGGYLVFEGDIKALQGAKSLTAQYIRGEKKIPVPRKRRKGSGNWLTILGASENNLKGIDIKIPLGTLTCVTGVAGAGKSTLIGQILYPFLLSRLYGKKAKIGKVKRIEGSEYIDRIINIDQRPLTLGTRSNPATLVGVFSHIRSLFSRLPASKIRGWKGSRFSFNQPGGRCELCKGEGFIKVNMSYLPEILIRCERCNGKRYTKEILDVRFKGYNISEILDLTVDKA